MIENIFRKMHRRRKLFLPLVLSFIKFNGAFMKIVQLFLIVTNFVKYFLFIRSTDKRWPLKFDYYEICILKEAQLFLNNQSIELFSLSSHILAQKKVNDKHCTIFSVFFKKNCLLFVYLYRKVRKQFFMTLLIKINN